MWSKLSKSFMERKNKPKVIILRTAGTNCDQETYHAFKNCGAQVDLVHINRLLKKEIHLNDYHILAIPGGFTYGDDIESGRILANELRFHLADDLRRFIDSGKLVIGICNGFQVLVKAGILPGNLENQGGRDFNQTATLTNNDSGKFEDRWIHLKVSGKSAWTKDLEKNVVYFPVAHAEGKFVPRDKMVLEQLNRNRQIVFRYCSKEGGRSSYPGNPNGSVEDIAGIVDKTGRVLGLMPHPERHFCATQHPSWTRLSKFGAYGDGAKIFQNGVNYVKENLLS